MISLRWKIVLLCAAVMLVPVLILNRYSVSLFDSFTRRMLEDQMIDAGVVAGEQYKALLDSRSVLDEAGREQLTERLQVYGPEMEVRIQMLSTGGIVLADSATNAMSVGENLSTQPEVQRAMAGRYKARWAMTPDRSYMYYYCAVPVLRDGMVRGVAYVSRHTSPIVRTVKEMVRFQREIVAGSLGVGLALAAILAWTITRRLRRLTAGAAAFARGEAAFDVTVSGRDEVAELADAIRKMSGDIRRQNAYNREFISTVMHELKMPITAIKGAAELLEQGAFDKPGARGKFLGNIRFEADRLARLVWELNELTKLDTESARIQKERVEYGACVREIVERFQTALEEPHAEIRMQNSERRFTVVINVARIEQVIGNLLDNAARYTPAGGWIEVRVDEGPDGTVVTTVKDTGCGISPANQEKVFDRFFTTEPKDKPKSYGSGLGLAIARSIVENHHGSIRVESQPGEGATFIFALPLAGD